ncbi:MAU2 chromatid cohesion factor like protein [Verticillium longisporum]|uniref:MAU2 chromatid cohesion factor like protein n=1 Tax=Verticillium longisporum TaxID=100787 RepID=A0A8I2Z8Y9_VERLO|nr:MAU2 chromatid cohesion factor like protein [Verticillium longisporum]
MTSKTRPFESATVLVHVAEECLSKAYSAVHSVAASPDEGRLREYQKLISTGLACLDAAVQTNKLAPRQEAKARLRYASILYEETENLQEAETTLFQGIKLCEKHRYTDLKYCMQYAALKVLFQRNHKAAFIAIDKQIAECQTFKHYPWLYAFRLLKTTLQTYAGNAPDATHFDNLQMLGNFAYERGDNAIGVLASLLEGLAHLRVMKSDSVERVQTCLAQAAMYQLDPAVKVPQLDILTLLLDLACKVCVPMKKQPSSSLIISEDTTAILRPGKDDEGTDLVVLSFLSKQELFALVHAFGGLANMYRPASREQVGKMKSLQRWAAGLETVQHVSTQHMLGNRAMATVSLHESIRQTKWRTEIFCYLQLLIGLYNATQSKWKLVDQSVSKLQKAATPAPLCTSHPDSEFRTAFSLVQVTTQPDLEMNIVKQNIQSALNGAQRTNNTHCLAIALTIMRCRLFENVVGEQALKSAKAASQQARRSGNLLWMSVADGMLANSYEVQGQLAEARAAQAAAQENASRAARAFE